MEKEERLKILKQLSQTRGDKAVAALIKELAKASEMLSTKTGYYALNSVLEELSVYAFRVHEESFETISAFLSRTEQCEFVENDSDYRFPSGFHAQQNLIKEALEIVERIRYFDLTTALDIFCAYCSHDQEDVRKKALEGLERCAAFDIDIYYSGENRAGFGEAPQLEVIAYLEANRAQFSRDNIEAAATLARELLSSTMEGTSWDYQTVVWSTGAIPYTDHVSDVRSRTLQFLKDLYRADLPEDAKRSLISAQLAATEVPRSGEFNETLRNLIEANTLSVFDWIKSIIPAETLPIRQKLEHDVYWRFYHGITNKIRASALEIRDLLEEDEEYQVYRNLIGFESIFDDWEESLKKNRDFAKIDKERNARAQEYVDGISEESWPQWRDRIFRFCATRSNDLATFPIFHGFLQLFAEKSPDLALLLLQDDLDKIHSFEVPLLRGLWKGPRNAELRDLMLAWIGTDQQLIATTKLFLANEELDKEILEILLKKGRESANCDVLALLVGVAVSNYTDGRKDLVTDLFLPAIEALTEHGDVRWLNEIWYRKERKSILEQLGEEGAEIILNGLLKAKGIDYHAEELLVPLAKRNPKRIIAFFRERLEYKSMANPEYSYDAIPFTFHKLHEILAEFPDVVVETVRSWFDGNDLLFQYRGGNLLKIIFPGFAEPFAEKLLELVKSGDRQDCAFVLSIIQNYEGQPFLHEVCREIVAKLPKDDVLLENVSIALQNTGVVTGEFGFAEAYERKKEEIRPWHEDKNEMVRTFAAGYVALLDDMAKSGRLRAEEDIELRKHTFGVREKPAEEETKGGD